MLREKLQRNFRRGVLNLRQPRSRWFGSSGTTSTRRPKNYRWRRRSWRQPTHLTETHCANYFELLLMPAMAVTKPIGSLREMIDRWQIIHTKSYMSAI